MNRHSPCQPDRQHAVALIVTLIMLAVITTLAIAFLALTRRETAAVDAMGRATDAELAADAGLERAKAELLAPFIRRNAGTNNGAERMGPDFMVSVFYDTNRIYNPPNKLLNNRIDPAVPVFVNTNRVNQNGPLDDRAFLDLNRDGNFQETGALLVRDDNGNPIPRETNWVVGDPQWIGILQHPEVFHGPTNRYVGRYAYAILPTGRGLDINWIHNQALNTRPPNGGDNYFRNQGFGAYEINLAAFLADLNTNVWQGPTPAALSSYNFNPDPTSVMGHGGVAFLDARELLNYRYSQNFSDNLTPLTLLSINQLFPSVPNDFLTDWIDGYANGPVQVLGDPIYFSPNAELNDNPSRPWPGSDAPRHFYSLHDFFDPQKLPNPTGFRARLQQASDGSAPHGRNSYNEYTYYRMLAQLGTDSDPEENGKIHINYDTNELRRFGRFTLWEPTNHFHRIAGRLLKDEFDIELRSGKGIPIFTNGLSEWIVGRVNNGALYSSRIHQILQIAANICDATYSNKFNETYPYYPSVFRPQFERSGDNLYITGYDEVRDPPQVNSLLTAVWLSLDEPTDRARIGTSGNFNVYGIPIIIGARKGFPNFNEFTVQTAVEFSRKLEFEKRNVSDVRPRATNQMFIVGISNAMGVEAWYPYTNSGAYPPAQRTAGVRYDNLMVVTLTNSAGLIDRTTHRVSGNMPINSGSWTGGQFRVPALVTLITRSNSVYHQGPPARFEPVSDVNVFDQGPLYTNRWGLTVTNRFFYFMTEMGPDNKEHIVDAVSLAGANKYFNLSEALTKGATGSGLAGSWKINSVRGVPEGVLNQIQISLGNVDAQGAWNDYGGLNPVFGNDKAKAIDRFLVYMGFSPRTYPTNQLPAEVAVMQAPFTPTRKMYQTTSWSANDPLVHYRAEELLDDPPFVAFTNQADVSAPLRLAVRVPLIGPGSGTYSTLSNINTRYNPWGGRSGSSTSTADYELAEKDPYVFNPDYWDFPTYKLPNIGWLGRIHRGTPWQTIYFKSRAEPMGAWRLHTGGAFSRQTHPVNDWRLADLFTVAVHPNQTRGRLSINQTNYAAWSAVLSGIQVSTVAEDSDGKLTRRSEVIQPAAVDVPTYGANAAVLAITDGTNGVNVVRTNFQGLEFTRLSDVLSVPALTDESPYFKEPYISARAAASRKTYQFPATDSDYERIPQQILSLLRTGDSQFVVYAWGQSLKPAPPVPGFGPSIVTAGADKGLCKNYQVTGEMATRSVVRIEFEDELAVDRNGNLILDGAGRPIRTGRRDYRRPHAVIESFNIIPVD
jgi:hypothetical protein